MDGPGSALEFLISGFDYACCGVPFSVGDELGFSLRAYTLAGADPAAGSTVHYFDDRHGASEPDRPVDVRGRVEAIVALYERIVPVAGSHALTNDPGDTVEREVEAVPADKDATPDGYGSADYRVRLRVPAGTALPRPVVRDPAEFAPGAGRAPAQAAPRIAPLLSAVVADVAARFGDAVVVLRAREDASVTLQPRTPGAAVRWNAFDEALIVELERAEWTLTPDAQGVTVLRELVEAAAIGGFSESVGGDGVFRAEARMPGGAMLTAPAQGPRFPDGGGVVATALFERLQRARSGRPYPPW